MDLLVRLELVKRDDLEDWYHGRVPYLERVITTNLTRANRILRLLRMHAHDLDLRPSVTVYIRCGNGSKHLLRFTKTGDLRIEQAYATHLVWPGGVPSATVRTSAPDSGTRARASAAHRFAPVVADVRRGKLRGERLAVVTARERVVVVPGQPVGRGGGDGVVVREERCEVAEGVAAMELGRDDERRVDVADESAVLRAVEERGVPVADRVFQAALREVVVDRRVRDMEEACQCVPAREQVAQGAAEARVRLHALVRRRAR